MPEQRDPLSNGDHARRLGLITAVTNLDQTPPTVTVALDGYTEQTVECGFVDTISPQVGDTVIMLSLGGHHLITARVQKAFQTGPSINGDWKNWDFKQPVVYTKSGGVVIVNGYMQRLSSDTVAGTWYSLFQLPAGYRPLYDYFAPCQAAYFNTFVECLAVVQAADGWVKVLTPAIVQEESGLTMNLAFVAQL